ncbi:Amidohydrolase EgtC [Aquisphaera giovannonii]|uniref:Amidohydrolase EgtC n=1 Tax=Aquisphaera giovannonii TaxID=406548 RepID=A0A5B9WGJ5_9BACT|nr:hypothetical protein [Aquisphaera giovannonii]QEH39125.1 Amidohydrolase EgtC [Aquisphaera giovannonii]
MCRIVAYLGPPLTLSRLLHDAPHGLTDQSRNARLMHDSSVAGDGWGVGWFGPDEGAGPGLLKSILPLWSDENGKTMPHAIASGSIVGHVRYAAPNVETCFTNTPLFVMDGLLWTVNGAIEPWPGPISRALRGLLDSDHEADLRGSTDGEMLGALWRTNFRRAGGSDAAGAIRATLRQARDVVREHRGTIMINLLLVGRGRGVAVRYAESGEPNTLFTCKGEGRWQGGTLVASEPLDDEPGWDEVGPQGLVRFDGSGVEVEPLGLDEIEADSEVRAQAGSANGHGARASGS